MRLVLAFGLCMCMVQSAAAQVYLNAPPREDWYRRPLFRLTAFDTDQSDCLLLECGGEAMLIDGGSPPFEERLAPLLTQRGISRLKYVLNTHFHEDHIAGLQALMRVGFPIGAYLHPYTDYAVNVSERHKTAMALAKRAGVPTRQVFHGQELLLGESVLTLWRYEDGLSTNGRSMVTRVQFGDASILLTADIIGDTQKWLLKTLPPECLKADVVKAPHHAVTPMNLAFLTVVSPQAVLVTNNADRVSGGRVQLESRDIPAFYSGDGAVVFETDGDDWYIYCMAAENRP